MLAYINNLKDLPNFGCRTTGNALAELLRRHHTIREYDAIKALAWPGAWGRYARKPLKVGGAVPMALYEWVWKRRERFPRVATAVQALDRRSGGIHDYVTICPAESVRRFLMLAKDDANLRDLENIVDASDGVVINGEGTLLFGNPTARDTLYLLFILALSKARQKPIYLLNAMIAPCPYTGVNERVLNYAIPLLEYCSIVAVRDRLSYWFTETTAKNANLILIPDALFTWGTRIRAITPDAFAELGVHLQHAAGPPHRLAARKYICVSGSSSAWRYGQRGLNYFIRLVSGLQRLGHEVVCVATCDGDRFLEKVSRRTGTLYVPESTPVLPAAGLLASALAYVTGRYHPAIMASAGGTPCVFLRSNSHKTQSIQPLLGYDDMIEFSVSGEGNDDVEPVLARTRYVIAHHDTLSQRIRSSFDERATEAETFSTILPRT